MDTEVYFLVGKSFVIMSTIPPVKSAGLSAVADLKICTLSIMLVGKRSICMVFLSGSSPGISNPFNIDFVYLSPKPLT